MILNFEEYGIAKNLVEEIISGRFSPQEIESKIQGAMNSITSVKRREFKSHVNTLFLNVILNRTDDINENGINNSVEARRLLSWMNV
jgi:Zn-dependent M16 (insulinase) family peptidase